MKNYKIERISAIKFLGVLLQENLLWRDHIKYNENKVSEKIGILYKKRGYLRRQGSLSYIHSYISFHSFIHSCPYSHLHKLCQFNMGKCDNNKLKENPQSAKATNLHYLS